MKTITVSFHFALQIEIPDDNINNPSLILDSISANLINLEEQSNKLDYTITEVSGDIKPEYAIELVGSVI